MTEGSWTSCRGQVSSRSRGPHGAIQQLQVQDLALGLTKVQISLGTALQVPVHGSLPSSWATQLGAIHRPAEGASVPAECLAELPMGQPQDPWQQDLWWGESRRLSGWVPGCPCWQNEQLGLASPWDWQGQMETWKLTSWGTAAALLCVLLLVVSASPRCEEGLLQCLLLPAPSCCLHPAAPSCFC